MKLALIQMDNTSSIDDNIAKMLDIVNKHQADYYVFPESCITGYASDPEKIKTVTLDDRRLAKLQQLAAEKNCHIFAGANICDNDKQYIGYLHMNDTTDVYYKTHLGIKEEKVFSSGAQLKVFSALRPTGISICIESHYPDVAQSLRLKGAEMILVPFASPRVCGGREKLWHKYLIARAYDNQVYVFVTNLTGVANGLLFSGGMMAIDPRGNVLFEHYDNKEHVAVIEVDEDMVQKVRQKAKGNYIERRRPELYGG